MNYIFVFLGEFGYELLNWQGVIRKFKKTIKKRDKITICTRDGLEPFYDYADSYISISELSYFKNSVANMYWAHNPDCNYYKYHDACMEGKLSWELLSPKDIFYQNEMKNQIKEFVLKKLRYNVIKKFFNNYKFIFSSDYREMNGLSFGTKSMSEAKIYADLDLSNNEFIKILPCKGIESDIEAKLGFKLTEEYILCQTGARSVIQRSKEHVALDIVKEIARNKKVVLLDFDTGRKLDSKSEFETLENCYQYKCSSFKEQSVLIANAKYCLFFTEGDFRSHNYLPPFMGKNVYSVAPKTVFELGTTPLSFWNENVFKFGGQIIPVPYEELNDKKKIFLGY